MSKNDMGMDRFKQIQEIILGEFADAWEKKLDDLNKRLSQLNSTMETANWTSRRSAACLPSSAIACKTTTAKQPAETTLSAVRVTHPNRDMTYAELSIRR